MLLYSDGMMLDDALVPAVLTQPAKRKANSCSSYSASGSGSSSDSHSSDSESKVSHKSSSNSSKSDFEEHSNNAGLSRRSVLGLRTRPPKRVCIQSSDSDNDNEPCDKQSNGSDYVASESEKSEEEEDNNFSASESAESMLSDEYIPKKRTKTTTRRTKQGSAKVCC